MRIAIVGYGKMGKTIETIALSQGHEITLRIDSNNPLKEHIDSLEQVDVAIEFSAPDAAYEHIKLLLENQVPVVCGTTAWLDKKPVIEALCRSNDAAFFYASNFSLGVNLFFKLNKAFAALMNKYAHLYKPNIKEIHHTEKLDAPSGTAITLAEGLIEQLDDVDSWGLDSEEERVLGIQAERLPNVPGTHVVSFNADEDELSIKHIAHSRIGFAKGALLAAEWIVGKKGIFGMEDLLNS